MNFGVARNPRNPEDKHDPERHVQGPVTDESREADGGERFREAVGRGRSFDPTLQLPEAPAPAGAGASWILARESSDP
jgi:hypothetical protein